MWHSLTMQSTAFVLALAVVSVFSSETTGDDRQKMVQNLKEGQASLKQLVETVLIESKLVYDKELEATKTMDKETAQCVMTAISQLCKQLDEYAMIFVEKQDAAFTEAIKILNDPESKGDDLKQAEMLASNPGEEIKEALAAFNEEQVMPKTYALLKQLSACTAKQ